MRVLAVSLVNVKVKEAGSGLIVNAASDLDH